MPINGDCVITTQGLMLESRESAHRLVVRNGSQSLGLVGSTYRFDGGTSIEAGRLVVGSGSSGSTSYFNPETVLISDTTVAKDGALVVTGHVVGNVANAGTVALWGSIVGNLTNHGRLDVSGTQYGNAMSVAGNFNQSSVGALAFALAPAGWDSPAPLRVTGQAHLGGTLLIEEYSDAWGPYPLPTAGAHWILHAEGGVFGSFDRWISPGLFIDGSLRYDSHDVWFDLTRISLQAAVAGNGVGGAVTLASAANLDRAFAQADGFAAAPGSAARQRFLQSAGHLLWLADPEQAQRSIDSLSGAMHADLLHTAVRDGDARAIDARLARMQPDIAGGAWSQADAHGTFAGIDRWISPRVLVGGSSGIGVTDHGTDASGGQSDGQSQGTIAYLRWYGDDGRYAGARAGYARHSLAIDRPIDLARGGIWHARSQRALHVASLQAEAGRAWPLAGGRFATYMALDTAAMRSERATELGNTGFELALQAATQAELGASLGLRFAREWRFDNAGWLQLEAGVHHRQPLASAGAPLRAAFVGVPDAWFDLHGAPHSAASGFDLGLSGRIDNAWRWSLQSRHGNGSIDARAWQLRLMRPL